MSELDANVAAGTEYAEIGPDFRRKVGEPAGVRNRPAPAELERAEVDTVVGEVDDNGHGTGTFVAAGDPIPAALAEHPRRPARPEPSPRKR
jgi:hypothetical protein